MTGRFRNISTIFSFPTNRNLFARAHGITKTPRNSGGFGFPFSGAAIAKGRFNTIGGGMSEFDVIERAAEIIDAAARKRIGREFSQVEVVTVIEGFKALLFLAAEIAEETDPDEIAQGYPDDTGTIS